MKKQIFIQSICAGLLSAGMAATADAALVGRLAATPGGTDYQAYYDTEANLTWLADARLAESNTFGITGISSTGSMTWYKAIAWLAALNVANEGAGYLGFNDWRMPTTLVPDESCTLLDGTPRTDSAGYCSGSEMGNMFYNVFGASANSSLSLSGDPAELAKFSNIVDGGYWSGTEYAPSPDNWAWYFNFNLGNQSMGVKGGGGHVWAVRTGDVSAVPVPAAVWLFGSGLIGLSGIAMKKRRATKSCG